MYRTWYAYLANDTFIDNNYCARWTRAVTTPPLIYLRGSTRWLRGKYTRTLKRPDSFISRQLWSPLNGGFLATNSSLCCSSGYVCRCKINRCIMFHGTKVIQARAEIQRGLSITAATPRYYSYVDIIRSSVEQVLVSRDEFINLRPKNRRPRDARCDSLSVMDFVEMWLANWTRSIGSKVSEKTCFSYTIHLISWETIF